MAKLRKVRYADIEDGLICRVTLELRDVREYDGVDDKGKNCKQKEFEVYLCGEYVTAGDTACVPLEALELVKAAPKKKGKKNVQTKKAEK